MADYRVHVEEIEAAADGDIHMLCVIQRDDDGEWVPVINGHRTMVLDGQAVLAITESAMTDAEKRAAMLSLFKAEATAWGIDESDEAYNQLIALLPVNWDGNVNLDL